MVYTRRLKKLTGCQLCVDFNEKNVNCNYRNIRALRVFPSRRILRCFTRKRVKATGCRLCLHFSEKKAKGLVMCDKMDITKFKNFPNKRLLNCFEVDVDKIYFDQAMEKGQVLWRSITSAFTPFGIKQIDSKFARRITEGIPSGKEDPVKLEEDIRANENLHKIIKDNLIENLHSYVRAYAAEK